MYAIVKTGGKQYRVEQGQYLLVERLPVDDGATVSLQPLLYVDGAELVDGEDLSKVTVEARVLAHERGPKLRIVKFKPKRGYKRRTGHRQELTRIEVTSLKLASRREEAGAAAAAGADAPAPVAADAPAPVAADAPAPVAADAPASVAANAPAGGAAAPAPAAARTAADQKTEAEDGS